MASALSSSSLAMANKALCPSMASRNFSATTFSAAVPSLYCNRGKILSLPISNRKTPRKPVLHCSPARRSIRTNAIESSSSPASKVPKDRMCLPGCDYEHWLIVMEFPKDPKPSPEEMVDTYVKTLAQIVGSEEEAKKRIYAVCTTTYTGFQCLISEELSEKCKELPGVLWVLPDSYLDVPNKDYGGDKFVDGKVIPRPQPPPSERPPSRSRRPPRYETRRYEARPRQSRSNTVQEQETSS